MATDEYTHMYTRERMDRNLGVGNIAEAFLRFWFEEKVASRLPHLKISQFGYNPEGLVVGREKVEMLKRLRESPDFALFLSTDVGTPGERPIAGISVNGQGGLYTMHNARAPWLCWKCARGAQEACYGKEIGNLWFNRYNITNDYRGFTELFHSDVILISVIATWFKTVFTRVRDEGLEAAALKYIKAGRDGETTSEIDRFIHVLTRIQRGKSGSELRKYELYWMLYSQILDGRIPQSITGAPVSVGLPREVVCIDVRSARSERELVDYLSSLTDNPASAA